MAHAPRTAANASIPARLVTTRRAIDAWMALLVAVPLLALSPGAEAATGALPWGVGAELDGWRIERLQRHPEFVRLRLKRADDEAAIVHGDFRPGNAIVRDGTPEVELESTLGEFPDMEHVRGIEKT